MSLSLELADFEFDRTLIERIPPKLAGYYQALPLGYEEGALSVAMAHPENETALTVLRELVGTSVIPVRAEASAIRLAYKRFYGEEPPTESRVLAWSALPERAELVTWIASTFAAALSASVTVFPADHVDLETAITISREGQFDLTVIAPGKDQPLETLLSQIASSIVLVGEVEVQLCRRILVVLRGYSSDEHTLDWLATLLKHHDAAVTLLPLLPIVTTSSEDQITQGDWFKDHLEDCLNHTALRPSRAWLKFRQGQALCQVVDEIAEGEYGMVILAAEGYGEFVSEILNKLDRRDSGRKPTIFILRPPVDPHILNANLAWRRK